MTFTARTLITSALREIRVLGIGRSLTTGDADRALDVLGSLVDYWKTKRYLIYQVTRSSFTLVASAASKTLGPSGDYVVTTKPSFLASASVIAVGDTIEQTVDIITVDDYLAETNKAATATLPRRIVMELGGVNNTLRFLPIPTTPAVLYLGLPGGVTSFATIDASYSFPDGYYNAFALELARRLQRPFGKADDPGLAADAGAAIRSIEALNDTGPPEMPMSDVGAITGLYTDPAILP